MSGGIGVNGAQYLHSRSQKSHLLSLHRGCLMEVPVDGIISEEYYAVQYVKKYYIGRALITLDSNQVKVKFLHNAGAGKFG